jgi:hypothetical protein
MAQADAGSGGCGVAEEQFSRALESFDDGFD